MSTPYAVSQIPLTASGNVSPKRILTLSTTLGQTGVQASAATQFPVGISEMWTRRVPGSDGDDGYHAIADEQISYRGPGSIASLTLGTAVTNPRVPIAADANGKGAPAATGEYAIAIALQLGSAGEDIDVLVISPTYVA